MEARALVDYRQGALSSRPPVVGSEALVRKLVRKRTSVVGSEAATKGTRLLRGAATQGTLTVLQS
eukprot:1036225-Prorocentrum_minimum.AAC.2